MQLEQLIAALFIAAIALITPASATTYVYDGGGSGLWTDPLAWQSDSGYPNGPDDCVFIGAFRVPLSDATITIGSLQLDGSYLIIFDAHLMIAGTGASLEVGYSSCLDIGIGGILEFIADSSTPQIGGKIVLSSATSVLLASGDVRLQPDESLVKGSVKGRDNDAKIRIAAARNLFNEITIEGAMSIDSVQGNETAMLWNIRDSAVEQGVILANGDAVGAGILELGPSLILIDIDCVDCLIHHRPLYMANGGTMRFLRLCDGSSFSENPRLRGRFAAGHCGKFEILESVYTEGPLVQPFGGVVSAPGPAVFRYNWIDTSTYDEIATCFDPNSCGCP